MPVTLLGLPTDRNSSFLRGPAKAPAAIRAAMASDMGHLIARSGVDAADPSVMRDGGDLPLNETEADHEAIAAGAARAFEAGPALFLGGDHYVTWPVFAGLKAAGRPAPHIVHFDAHPDLYPDYEGNRFSHASPFARILEDGLAASLTQIGVRAINPVQLAQIDRYGVRAFPPERLPDAFAALPEGDVYVSFDLDGLDPAFAPGVSHHEPGGLTVREVLAVLDAIPGRVIGADIVEYNPDRDINGMTAAVCVKLLKELTARIHLDLSHENSAHSGESRDSAKAR
ncbi:MAG: arginase family protein [Caulobacteraceae bacterium]